jgi:hypothetical protein
LTPDREATVARTHVEQNEGLETATAPEAYPADPDLATQIDDHLLHVENETCARCGREIKATDEVRKTVKGDCVHMSC